MFNHPLLARLSAAHVVPLVRTSKASQAETAVRWLHDAGLRCFEIAMTMPDALALVRALASGPALLIGAGLVPDQAGAVACLDAGAGFICAPWVDASLAAPCRSEGALLMLGAMTPTEVRAALAAGAEAVRVFPAASAGGAAHIRALRTAFPRVAFSPAGGIELVEVGAYLAAGAGFVGLGGALVNERRIAAGDRHAIQDAARRVA